MTFSVKTATQDEIEAKVTELNKAGKYEQAGRLLIAVDRAKSAKPSAPKLSPTAAIAKMKEALQAGDYREAERICEAAKATNKPRMSDERAKQLPHEELFFAMVKHAHGVMDGGRAKFAEALRAAHQQGGFEAVVDVAKAAESKRYQVVRALASCAARELARRIAEGEFGKDEMTKVLGGVGLPRLKHFPDVNVSPEAIEEAEAALAALAAQADEAAE